MILSVGGWGSFFVCFGLWGFLSFLESYFGSRSWQCGNLKITENNRKTKRKHQECLFILEEIVVIISPPGFFLSICEVMFSYICFDSAQFCWKTVSMWNGATWQKVNLLSVTISSVTYNLLHVHHCCILLLYWAETVLQYERVFLSWQNFLSKSENEESAC